MPLPTHLRGGHVSNCDCAETCVFCTKFPELLAELGDENLFPEES